MPQTLRTSPAASGSAASLLPPQRTAAGAEQPPEQQQARGFGGGGAERSQRRRQTRRRAPALSKADWGPLGKHPDLEAIVARQRLRLPLSGRLTALDVNRAWKRCAAEHHPDRGGAHDTMQLVNGARDLLLGRGAD
jgi:hypothetical protein